MDRSYLLKAAFEPTLPLRAEIPLLVKNTERNILIWRPTNESDETGIVFACWSQRLPALAPVLALDTIGRRSRLVNQIWIEDVELVSLHHFRGRVVMVVMSLVVFVPLVSHLDTIEVSGFSWPILAGPLWFRLCDDLLLPRKDLFILLHSPRDLSLVQSGGGGREVFSSWSSKARDIRCAGCLCLCVIGSLVARNLRSLGRNVA